MTTRHPHSGDDTFPLGPVVARHMRDRGITLRQLARRVAVDADALLDPLAGRTDFGAGHLFSIARVLGTTGADLLAEAEKQA